MERERLKAGIHFLDASAPDGVRLYAIGDVHGRLDLLAEMHARIAGEIACDRPTDWRVVHLGDYVDRGPDSKGVLDLLVAAHERDPRFLALAGNHDIGFLDFLSEPNLDGLFVNYGGRETARSYGADIGFRTPDELRRGWLELDAAVPGRHRAFLRSLPYSVTFGDFFFCHAGIRPGVALERQQAADLIWIRDAFHRHAGLYEKVIVHGHTPADGPEIMPNRVNVDTGAWQTGVLTALVIDGAEKRILTVSDKA